MLIINGEVFTGVGFDRALRVRTENGRISEVSAALSPLPGETVLDLAGQYLLPGFVDVHIHAFRKNDAMRGEAEVRAMSRDLAALGVAAFCPTTMSAGITETAAAVRGIAAVLDRPEPQAARVLGAHMEAPFLNPARAGAQRAECFLTPSWDAFEAMTGGRPQAVSLMTVAPELPGSEALIRRARAAGVRISVGHTDADADQVHAAGDWGADHITHLFNAQPPLRHRSPGVPGAALSDDRFFCELICDGVHLHRDVIRLAVRCKGPEKAVAITDAMEAAGMPDGIYALGGQQVFVRGDEARLADGTLAGSVLTMPQALLRLIHRFDIDPAAACAMCTSAPAASVGAFPCGQIAPGSPLPLTRWTRDWAPAGVLLPDENV